MILFLVALFFWFFFSWEEVFISGVLSVSEMICFLRCSAGISLWEVIILSIALLLLFVDLYLCFGT